MDTNSGITLIKIIIAIVFTAYFLWQGFYYIRKLPGKKRTLWLILRMLTVLCLLLALMEVEWVQTHRSTTTLFVVDRSLSTATHQAEIENYIHRQLLEKKNKDRVGVITFAKEPMIESPLSKKIENFSLQTLPDAEFTNIEKALTFAVDYFPQNTNRRLVLFSDGQENIGHVEAVKKLLESNGIDLLIYPLASTQNKDVQLTAFHLPQKLHSGEKGIVEVVLNANMEGKGMFYLYTGSQKILEENLYVQKGKNHFQFQIPSAEETGNIQYKGEIRFPNDSNPYNDVFKVTQRIIEEAKVLVLGDPQDVENIDRLLESLSVEYTHFTAAQAPDSIDFLSGFDTVILANVNHQELSQAFERNLERCVKEQGMGLMVIGGEQTFSLGHYQNTVLEGMLPVECRMKGNKKQPNTGLVLVIDCSGSMEEASGGVKKIEMAKEAAIRSLEVLEEEDYIGILGFSDQLEWVVPYRQIQDKGAIERHIGKLRAKGGTLIIPGLEAAESELSEASAKVKHIILLSDGQGEKEGFEEMAAEMKAQNITLSAVAVGQGAEKELLEQLSRITGGRSYAATDFHQIPEIFTKETYLATKKYINHRSFIPQMVQETEYFPRQSLPPLDGYTGTGMKKGADLILQSDLEDPILALWQYGLGTVMVWTPDLTGQWSRQWLEWNTFQQQWGRLLNVCLAAGNEKDMEIQILQEGAYAGVYAKIQKGQPVQAAHMLLQGTDNLRKEIPLQQIRTGEFNGEVILDKTGEYSLSFLIHKDGKTLNKGTRILHLNYSPEHHVVVGDPLEVFRGFAHSRMIEKDSSLWDLPVDKPGKSRKPLDLILLPMALLFFIGDIWIRKR